MKGGVMQTHMIMNEIDNVENEAELHDALEIIADDIAAQLIAVWNAVRDNPYVSAPSLDEYMRTVESKAMALLDEQGS
jgi:hypothetical protein